MDQFAGYAAAGGGSRDPGPGRDPAGPFGNIRSGTFGPRWAARCGRADGNTLLTGPMSRLLPDEPTVETDYSWAPQYLQNSASTSWPSREQSGHAWVVIGLPGPLASSALMIPVGTMMKL